jgi:molybdopterin-biosynthesis enzyme MoeA-like protein
LGVTIGIRDDARAILQAHYDRQGQELNAARLRMARIPEGATLIDNPSPPPRASASATST